jgi:xanthine dehydrogenase iron-sulfur cluster and FAD-binding subunit A
MPVVYRQDGFRFIMRFNDHRPPHVHVENSDGEIVVALESFRVAVKKKAMKPGDVAHAVAIVVERQEYLFEEWKKIHG